MNCVVDWSRRLPTLTICKRSILWCMECPMLPWQPARWCYILSGRNASLQITFVVCHYTCQLIYPHKFEVCKYVSKHFSSHPWGFKSRAKLDKADPNLRGWTNYLPVTRETIKLVRGGQIRSPHCSWMIWSLQFSKLRLKIITVWLNLASENLTCPAHRLSSEVWWINWISRN